MCSLKQARQCAAAHGASQQLAVSVGGSLPEVDMNEWHGVGAAGLLLQACHCRPGQGEGTERDRLSQGIEQGTAQKTQGGTVGADQATLLPHMRLLAVRTVQWQWFLSAERTLARPYISSPAPR